MGCVPAAYWSPVSAWQINMALDLLWFSSPYVWYAIVGLFNTDPFKYNNKTTSHNGGLEFVYDYSPDVNTDYSFSDTSNTELYEIEKYSQSNIKLSYGIEEVYENNLTLSLTTRDYTI